MGVKRVKDVGDAGVAGLERGAGLVGVLLWTFRESHFICFCEEDR